MQIQVFSIAVIVFAVGGIVSPAPPPPAVVSQVEGILAGPSKTPPALHSAAAIGRTVASAE